MLLEHTIDLSVENQKQLDLNVDILINQNKIETVAKNSKIVFEYSYTQSNNVLQLILYGKEQEQKLLKINSIKIHNTDINVLSGLYETESNEWWQSLNQDQLSQARKQVLSHGGNFGWFGKISYYYEIQSKQLNDNNQSSIASLFRSKIRV